MADSVSRLAVCSRCREVYQRVILAGSAAKHKPLCEACEVDQFEAVRAVPPVPWSQVFVIVAAMATAFVFGMLIGAITQQDENRQRSSRYYYPVKKKAAP